MTWLAYVIVAVVFFLPGIGVSDLILNGPGVEWTFSLPFLPFSLSIPIPFVDLLETFFYSFVCWGIMSVGMYAVDRFFNRGMFLRQLHLRNGLLYATRPDFVVEMAVWMARFVLSAMTGVTLLGWLLRELLFKFGGFGILPGLQDAPNLAMLAALTIVANRAFLAEQRSAHEGELERQQQMRREQSQPLMSR